MCNACFALPIEITDPETAEVNQMIDKGHTYHCACRLVFGDGECECNLDGRPAQGIFSNRVIDLR